MLFMFSDHKILMQNILCVNIWIAGLRWYAVLKSPNKNEACLLLLLMVISECVCFHVVSDCCRVYGCLAAGQRRPAEFSALILVTE